MGSQAKGSKKRRTPGECAEQAARSNRNKLNRAKRRLRRLSETPKQPKPLITARFKRRHPDWRIA
jgi:hypothetical protein